MAERSAFDLFDGLEKLGSRKLSWYDDLTPEGQKSASPLVIMRWMTGTSDQAQLVRINSFVNRYVFPLGQEKKLLFKALAASATGKVKRYHWIKGPGARSSEKLMLEVVKQYYGVSSREAQGYQIDRESALQMAEELGWGEDELKKLKKELDS